MAGVFVSVFNSVFVEEKEGVVSVFVGVDVDVVVDSMIVILTSIMAARLILLQLGVDCVVFSMRCSPVELSVRMVVVSVTDDTRARDKAKYKSKTLWSFVTMSCIMCAYDVMCMIVLHSVRYSPLQLKTCPQRPGR